MSKKQGTALARLSVPAELIERRIYLIRGHKVMLDSDLAELYQVETKNLNKAVGRNLDRFPADFMFKLTAAEESLRFQFGTSNKRRGGRRLAPGYIALAVELTETSPRPTCYGDPWSMLDPTRGATLHLTSRRLFQLGVGVLVLATPALYAGTTCSLITPEPATFWLIGTGAGAILVLRRMRAKK